MKIFKYIFFVFFILLFNVCSVKSKVSNNIIIEFKKTPCRGQCPAFEVKIASNGYVLYEGKQNVNKLGVYKSKLSKDQYNDLIDKFEKIDLFSFRDSYTSLMMDLPTKYIIYNKDGQRKQIKAYDNIPKEITYLINQLDELIKSLDWKKIE